MLKGGMFLDNLKVDFPVYLAPMAGISDISFRTLMRRMGCGITVTELISSEAMIRYNERTKRMIRVHAEERPTGVQIFGHNAGAMADTAKMVEDAGADFVDINLGCPVRKITKQGAGAALLDDLPSLEKILTAVKSAITVPLTIKIRTGFTNAKLTYNDVTQLAYDCGIAAVAIHGRTREQAYEGKADWQLIADAKRNAKLPIIGNGDLVDAQQSIDRWRESGVDGIMIGRGALRNPWIFQEIRALLNGHSVDQIVRDPFALLRSHRAMLEEYERERQALLQIKKFVAWYLTGMPGIAKFRARLFQLTTFDDVFGEAMAFLENQPGLILGIRDDERFLMGGHG